MTDLKSTLSGSSDELRRQISDQRYDAEMVQGALMTLLCDHYDEMLELLGRQIDANTYAIEDLAARVDRLSSGGGGTDRYRPGREYRELGRAEKEAIDKLMAVNRVTPIGLTEQDAVKDEFDELDRLAAEGKIDPEGGTSR